jgi:hypothetical protein
MQRKVLGTSGNRAERSYLVTKIRGNITMKRWLALATVLLALASPALAAPKAQGPEFVTEDVTRFYQVYDAAGGKPTAEQLDADYLGHGTQGLRLLARIRNVTGARIAANIEAHPETYAEARRCMAVLPSVGKRLAKAFDKLATLYPEARFPPTTIVVGRGRPVGVTEGEGIVMGLEALCWAKFLNPDPENRFVYTIAHEYAHVQQAPAVEGLDLGKPEATVLRVSLVEGTGEFVAELIAGGVGQGQHAAWAKGREREIAQAFVHDMDKTDVSGWLYNGPGDAAKPGDLGYWVGYRIVKAYYDKAKDKRAALKAIFLIRDPKAFLAESGWGPDRP